MITQELLRQYEIGEVIGAFVDSMNLPLIIRQLAQRQRAKYFAEQEESPLFADKASHLQSLASEKGLALPFVPYLKLDNDALTGAQATGDCFSWATRAAIDITRVNENIHYGESSYIESSATCLIYGLRGHAGQGMSLYSVFDAVEKGGILLEKPYNINGTVYDFSSYENYWHYGAIDWPRRGVPAGILEQTQQKVVQEMAVCETMEELDAVLFSGRAVSCGSSINPERTATKGLVGLQRTPIAHAMTIIGVDKTREYFNFDVYVWDNSWGNYFTYNSHFPWAEKLNIPMPEGYFCLSRDDTWKAIRDKGSGVFSNVVGFPKLELPDLGTIGGLA